MKYVTCLSSTSVLGWQNVQYFFLPNRDHPLEVHFHFLHPTPNRFIVKLPVTDTEAHQFVDQKTSFALSPGRVERINRSCLDKYKEPFISYAYHQQSNQVLVVSKITATEIVVR